MRLSSVATNIPEVAVVLAHADYADEKMARGDVSMRAFITNMLNYQPAWVSLLFGLRGIFVRLLGMPITGIPRSRKLQPETVPMTPGERASFFKVQAAEDERYWIADIRDRHLNAAIAVVVEDADKRYKCFHVL